MCLPATEVNATSFPIPPSASTNRTGVSGGLSSLREERWSRRRRRSREEEEEEEKEKAEKVEEERLDPGENEKEVRWRMVKLQRQK